VSQNEVGILLQDLVDAGERITEEALKVAEDGFESFE